MDLFYLTLPKYGEFLAGVDSPAAINQSGQRSFNFFKALSAAEMVDALLQHICCDWFGQEGRDLGWIKADDSIAAFVTLPSVIPEQVS